MVWCLLFFISIFHNLAFTVQYIKLTPYTSLFLYPLLSQFLAMSQIGSGIGRMILKEEMKARSGSYDNDPWGSARNSRCGSKETLNTTGYGTSTYNNTVNGCKDPPCPLCIFLFVPSSSFSLLVSLPLPFVIICAATRAFFYEPQYQLSLRQSGCGCRSERVMAAAGRVLY